MRLKLAELQIENSQMRKIRTKAKKLHLCWWKLFYKNYILGGACVLEEKK